MDTAVIFSISISAILSVIIVIIFKYPFKPEIEKIFEKNLQYANKIIFEYLGYSDGMKKHIYEQLSAHPDFKPNSSYSLKFSEFTYNEIIYHRKIIEKNMHKIQILQKDLKILDIEQYIVIQQYNLSLLASIRKLDNYEFSIYYDSKSLTYHKYYAKRIIELFGKNTDKDFAEKWHREFAKVGGIHAITRESIKPGDMISSHFDMYHEILFFDAGQNFISEKFKKISAKLDKLIVAINRNIKNE